MQAMTRREIMRMGMGAAALASAPIVGAQGDEAQSAPKPKLRQSVSRWCFGGMSLDDLCKAAKDIGLMGIDLLGESDWDTVRKHGLECTMVVGIGTIPDGWNRVKNHDKLVAEAEQLIPKVAAAGWTNVVTFSGNRAGISDDEGLANCVIGLKRIAALAERHKVTVCVELLNSKRSHPDYQCDRTPWGVELCGRVGSERVKLLYDIFHMQIMEGDLCDTIRENIAYIAHVHTGGVPGRAEIDATQEINYPRVCKALLDAGYKGVVAHEFVPKRDPVTSLREAFRICDV
ncbi:MAG: TIM barrel protein [Chthonomonadales bacterium]|nr:TIM barrel protein [Chthonomonadales bacterium]